MCDKKTYLTYQEALKIKNKLSSSNHKTTYVYKCKECGSFHLTSMKINMDGDYMHRKNKNKKDYLNKYPKKILNKLFDDTNGD